MILKRVTRFSISKRPEDLTDELDRGVKPPVRDGWRAEYINSISWLRGTFPVALSLAPNC